MKISVITNGISQDYETCCKVMNELGVKYAEIQEVNGKRIELATEEEMMAIKALNEKYGIEVSCITTHAFVGIPVGSLEVGDDTYNAQMDLLKNGFKAAKILGAVHVRTMCFGRTVVLFGANGSDKWCAGGQAAWPKFVELFRPICKAAEAEGISLVVENGFNGMVTSSWTFAKLAEDLGEDGKVLNYLWDPANALYVGEAMYPQGYDCVKTRMGHIHIKDVIIDTVKSTVRCMPIGQGQLAQYLVDTANALRADGYEGFVSLENILRPEGKDFVDGCRIDTPTLIEIFG